MGLLQGKICLVTGAGKGIGHAIAEKFACEGAIVYANARKEGSIDTWAEKCSSENMTEVIPVYFDVRDFAKVKEIVIKIKKDHGRLDVLVNNAGLVSYEFIGMINFDTLRKMFEVNVVSLINIVQLCSRLMTRQKKGSIINISSIVGVEGSKGQASYSATKGAVVAFTRSAAKEFAPHNVRVNAIAPGMVNTERFREVFEKNFSERISNIGMGRLAEPEEIADMCVFLGSDRSSYLTGQVITIDGSTSL